MSYMEKYSVFLGDGIVYQGPISGNAQFAFDQHGFYVYFYDTKNGYRKESLNNFLIKKQIIDKFEKGSKLAKFAALSVAANKNLDYGTKVAMSQRYADEGKDKVIQKEVYIVEFTTSDGLFSIILDTENHENLRRDINLAFNDPVNFFNESLNNFKENFNLSEKKELFLNKYLSAISFFVCGIIFLIAMSNGLSEDMLGVLAILTFVVPALIFFIFNKKNKNENNSFISSFKKSEEYIKAIENLKS